LSTTNPTWPDPVSNPGRRGKPATNRLSYGTALVDGYWRFWESSSSVLRMKAVPTLKI
jgi:hypothetical protein